MDQSFGEALEQPPLNTQPTVGMFTSEPFPPGREALSFSPDSSPDLGSQSLRGVREPLAFCPHSTPEIREAGPCVRQLGAPFEQNPLQPTAQPRLEVFHGKFEVRQDGGKPFGRSGGGRGTVIRHEIRNGEIHLVANGGHGGHRGGVQRTRDRFFVEGPEVFQGTATPGDHDDVHVRSVETLECAAHVLGGPFPLYPGIRDQDR
jgi:hypothetical protein